jgi:hypothetical protein
MPKNFLSYLSVFTNMRGEFLRYRTSSMNDSNISQMQNWNLLFALPLKVDIEKTSEHLQTKLINLHCATILIQKL